LALKTHALDQLPDDEVTAALQQLPTELRIVVYLAGVEDFPPTEIAEILGLSPGTATSRLRHGHDSLLQTLTDAARRRGLLD
jgi:RNA polymerase sigma-70 factor (ECF subfamily)